jgi:energy-coupling factor transporter ATP-binding protein EcfA2
VSLVLVYVSGVVVLQRPFYALTGGESQLAVVASTLAMPSRGRRERRLEYSGSG